MFGTGYCGTTVCCPRDYWSLECKLLRAGLLQNNQSENAKIGRCSVALGMSVSYRNK